MDHKERIERIDKNVESMRTELKEYAKTSIINQQDIKWIKGSLKIGLSFILPILGGIILFLIKQNI